MPDQVSLDLISRAVNHHRMGELTVAEDLLHQVLAHTPNQPDALHLLGVFALNKGDVQMALELIERAVSHAPTIAAYHVTLGNAELAADKIAGAVDSYRRAVMLDPTVEGAHNNLGLTLRQLGKETEAVAVFAELCASNPNAFDGWINYAATLRDMGRLIDAEVAILQARALNPGSTVVLSEIASLRIKQNRIDEAIALYREAVAISPDNAEAHENVAMALLLTVKDDPFAPPPSDIMAHLERATTLAPERWSVWEKLGEALLRLNRFDEALIAFNRATAILRCPGGGHDHHLTFRLTSRAKLTHDLEQIRYLIEHRRIGVEGPELFDAYQSVLARLPAPPQGTHIVEMDIDLQYAIGATYNRMWNIVEAPNVQGHALTQLDSTAVERDYAARDPGITWVDNFLTPEALASLQRFCLESTVWFDCFYPNNYFGAYIEDGFYCPLLMQIGHELPQLLPGIFGNHTLRKVWAYKYGDEVKGIESHADFAAINVNFWITPDSANRDPYTGGMVIWDREAPAEWDFTTFNTDQAAMDNFIRSSGAKAHTVPYRCNRAVIFNSNLLHRTDDIHFKPGYDNRRINITYLYGRREGRV